MSTAYLSSERIFERAQIMIEQAHKAALAEIERGRIRPRTDREIERELQRAIDRETDRKQWFEITLPSILARGAAIKQANGTLYDGACK